MNPTFAAFAGLLNGITGTILGLLVLLRNRRREANWSYGLFCLSVALWSYSYFFWQMASDNPSALFWSRMLMAPAIFIPIFYAHHILALFGPKQFKRPTLLFGYIFGVIFFFADLTTNFVKSVSPKLNFPYWPNPGSLFHVFLPIWVAFVLWGVYIILYNFKRARGMERNQLRYVLIATVIGWTGGVTNFFLWYNIPVPPVGNILVSVYVGLTAYAIARYRLMDISLALTRTTVFMAVYASVLGIPFLAALAWRPQLEHLLGTNWWVGLWIICAALTTAAHYANQYFQRRAENRLLAEQHRYQGVLRNASQGMTLVKDLDKLLNRTVRIITREVRLKHAAVYLWDERAKRFVPKASRQWTMDQPPTFSEQDPLVDYFTRWHKGPLVAEELDLQARGDPSQAGLHRVVAALKTLDASMLIPSFVNRRCMGFLILGQKRSGAIFTPDDLEVFQVLANQAGLAIENAIFYEELQRTQTDLFQTAKMASLGHMAGGMSHQANNRFYVLSTLGGVLKAKFKELGLDPFAVPPETLRAVWAQCAEFGERVEKNAIQGGDIVKTILRFSRPSGEYKPVALPQIIATVHEVAQFRVDLNLLNWKEAFPENLAYVNGDLNQLADCVLNLITNAFDAIQKKAELLKKHELPVNPEDPVPFKGELIFRGRMDKDEDGKHWSLLEVKDNGVGMTPQEIENLFIPFFTTKATSQKGTGLGIFVIRRIIEQHGGTVTASSSYGIGTTFTIRLPAL